MVMGSSTTLTWSSASSWAHDPDLGVSVSRCGESTGPVVAAAAAPAAAPAAAATVKKDLRHLWELYVKNSTVHGVVYAGSVATSGKARLVWFAAMLVALLLANYCVRDILWGPGKYATTTRIAAAYLQPSQFAFPALSLCPLNKVRKRVGIQLLSEHLGLSPKALNETTYSALLSVLRALSFLEVNTLTNIRTSVHLAGGIVHHLKGVNVTDLMLKALPTCDELFERCYWHGVRRDCCTLLELQRSEIGFCYSFNSLTSIRTVNCNAQDESEGCILHRTSGYGPGSGLLVFLKELPDREILKYRMQRGLVVVLHQNQVLPVPAAGFVLAAGRGQSLQMSVSVDWTTVSDEVLGLAVSQRLCLADGDVRSWFAGAYSAGRCITRCRLDFIFQACGCMVYMYAVDAVGATPGCDLTQLKCLQELHETRILRPPYGFPEDGLTRRGLNCSHCMASCEVVSYESRNTLVDGGPGVSRAGSLDIFMDPREPIVRYQVTLNYNLLGRLIVMGGMAGLCLGMSIVSVVEALVYLLKAAALLAAYAWTLARRRWGRNAALHPEGPEPPRRSRSLENSTVVITTLY